MDFEFILSVMPDLLHGLLMTLEVGLISLMISLVIGILGAAVVDAKIPVLSQILGVYVELFRNTPILVQIYFLYFGLPSIGIVLSELTTGILEFSLWGGAFAIDNFSAGFGAVPNQTKEAGVALGMSRRQIYANVIIPIGIRNALPSFSNTALSIVKCTNYLAGIGLFELTKTAMRYVTNDFKVAEMFVTMAVIYLVVVMVMSYVFQLVERGLKHQPKEARQ